MYYTNITFEEALTCTHNGKVFVWTEDDSEWNPNQVKVTFQKELGQVVDATSVFVGVKDLVFIEHTN